MKQSLLILLLWSIVSPVLAENADILIEKGRHEAQIGHFENAAGYWEQAANLLNKKTDSGRYMDTMIHLGTAYQSLGYHQKSVTLFHELLPLAEQSKDLYRKSQFYSNLGDLYLSLGRTDDADSVLNKALESARQTKHACLISSVLINVGNLLAADQDIEGAMDAYSEAIELVNHNCDPALQSKAVLNLLQLTAAIGEEKEIKEAVHQAFNHIETLSDSHEKAVACVRLGLIIDSILKKQDFSDETHLIQAAYQSFDSAAKLAVTLNDPRTASDAYGYYAKLYESENRNAEAVSLTRRAIFYAQMGNFTDKLYLWQWQMGRLLKKTGSIQGAIALYTDAVATLNPIRSELFRGLRIGEDVFNEQVKPVYLGLAELYLETGKIKEARDTMELLKTAELQDFFKDECTTLLQSSMTSLDQTPPHTAVIYPIVLPKSLAIIIMLPNGMDYISVPVDSSALYKTVTLFRHQLQNRMNNRFLYSSEQLYQWVIRPIESKLSDQGVTSLIIAPDGPLRLVPMSALYDGERFLVEKYAIAIIPAVTLTDPKPFQQQKPSILLCGLSEARQGFSPLPSVPAELSDIKTIMDGRVVLMNQEFNLSNLTNEFKTNEYGILHIATHGIFGGTPQESYLLNYDTKLTMDGLEQLIGLARFRDKPVELLTLSACQTALGNERAALGLAGVAVKAGVRSAIATLWYVDDEATSLAIREFYRQITTSGISKAIALQNVQKQLISKPRYWHPLYWAPFILIGNWM